MAAAESVAPDPLAQSGFTIAAASQKDAITDESFCLTHHKLFWDQFSAKLLPVIYGAARGKAASAAWSLFSIQLQRAAGSFPLLSQVEYLHNHTTEFHQAVVAEQQRRHEAEAVDKGVAANDRMAAAMVGFVQQQQQQGRQPRLRPPASSGWGMGHGGPAASASASAPVGAALPFQRQALPPPVTQELRVALERADGCPFWHGNMQPLKGAIGGCIKGASCPEAASHQLGKPSAKYLAKQKVLTAHGFLPDVDGNFRRAGPSAGAADGATSAVGVGGV